ncbi:diguanylate cyclase [Geobacillus sp. C56-T2]|uniref:sensor domain-containing diguanylate cyclase n=1 Tax=Geobacillus sp. C56-T2 TaxID=600773 RepID=UPI0011A0DBC8|nr:diguanylate cyclase [Geobacillus sp. C56-T2]NNV06002.1 diguanylate cyclase [Geobacillus sp. MMMUD3]
MSMEEMKRYESFKQKFFHWFLAFPDDEPFLAAADELLALLKEEMGLEQAVFYLFDPERAAFYPEASTGGVMGAGAVAADGAREIALLDGGSHEKARLFFSLPDGTPALLELTYRKDRAIDQPLLQAVRADFADLFGKLAAMLQGAGEEKRYGQLHRFAAKIHSSMRIDDVLEEIIRTLQNVYPSFTYYLLLSHDNHLSDHLPIKALALDEGEGQTAALRAFLTGQVQCDELETPRRSVLYAPIKGVQAVYGVIQIIAPYAAPFPQREVRFISLLAGTAGSALENAKLYEQSRRLVADLQLINDTMRQLNARTRLHEGIEYMVSQIRQSFGADEVGFFLFANGQRELLPGSTPFFYEERSAMYVKWVEERRRDGQDILFAGDAWASSLTPFRSIMAAPMQQNKETKGVCIALAREPYRFTFEMFKLLESLVQHSTLAFMNAILREELEKLVVTDYLTKLYTRRYLDETIQKSMETDGSGAFLLIDIDNFKQINDLYGHQIGDEVLIRVAETVRTSVRESDVAARWGGEELAVYLPNVHLVDAVAAARRITEKVRQHTAPAVTVSCGVSWWGRRFGDNAKQLFKQADKALYRAKEMGKNCIFVYDGRRLYKA